jgi:hypothetical protein
MFKLYRYSNPFLLSPRGRQRHTNVFLRRESISSALTRRRCSALCNLKTKVAQRWRLADMMTTAWNSSNKFSMSILQYLIAKCPLPHTFRIPPIEFHLVTKPTDAVAADLAEHTGSSAKHRSWPRRTCWWCTTRTPSSCGITGWIPWTVRDGRRVRKSAFLV